jgi:hypothetical protein
MSTAWSTRAGAAFSISWNPAYQAILLTMHGGGLFVEELLADAAFDLVHIHVFDAGPICS